MKKKAQKPNLIKFDEKCAPFILKAFKITTRKGGILYRNGKRCLGIDGKPVKRSEFAGILPGGRIVRKGIVGIVELADFLSRLK